MDGYVSYGTQFTIMLKRFAAVSTAEDHANRWMSLAAQVVAAGTPFGMTSCYLWPGLSPERLSQVLRLRSLSHRNVADVMNALPTSPWGWRRVLEDGEVLTLFARAPTLLNIQLVMASKLPSFLRASETEAMLPPPGHSKRV